MPFNWFRRKEAEPPPRLNRFTEDLPSNLTRDLRGKGWEIRLDLTPQVLSLGMEEELTLGFSRADRESFEEPLEPICPVDKGFVSASMLAVKAKLFDDGLYAAAETAAQSGKARLLASLVDVAPRIAAAARLGGMETPLSSAAQRLTEEFLANDLESKPLGFYTWSDPLRRIFQQDRLLQQKLDADEVAALTAALGANAALSTAYGTYLDFVARLTNPLSPEMPDLRRPGGAWFFPPSRSHESDLIKRLYGDQPIPDGFSLADEIVKRLVAGTLKLDPTEASGWYDLQTWALEPLVRLHKMPESAKITTNDEYRSQLKELFKAVLALTRETHVKQVERPMPGSAMPRYEADVPVWVQPTLSVEPVRSYYERRAQGYEFVRQLLEDLGPTSTMHRQTANGPARRSLDDELSEMTDLFHDAAAVAGHELGMAPATQQQFSRLQSWAKGPDIGEDIRMMVPVFHDIGRGKTKVWAILGWAVRHLTVEFDTPPAVHVLKGRPKIEFAHASYRVAFPILAEAYVTRLLNRDEFRAHCDRYGTRSRILQNL